MIGKLPERIVCLTEETTETLYLLGEEKRIVGVSKYTVRPPEARRDKEVVSAFITADVEKIVSLEPDLILGFSDLQGDIASELIKRGLPVMVFNQRSVDEIYSAIIMIGNLVGVGEKARLLVDKYDAHIQERWNYTKGSTAPRIYFEEWNEPLISGIKWNKELVAFAGGEDCFPELGDKQSAKERIIADHREVINRAPDIILASWCGKKFKRESLINREGWVRIPAVKNNHIYEIDSSIILQPGPAVLTEGFDKIVEIIDRWRDDQTQKIGET